MYFSLLIVERNFETETAGACVISGKAIPLQALTGPEGTKRLRLPDFKTIGT
jgi:hypothetical protein